MSTRLPLALLALLCCACPGGRGARVCDVDALDELGRELEPAMNLDRAWTGVRAACGDELPTFSARAYDADTIARMRRSALGSSLDASEVQRIEAACPAWAEAQPAIADVPAEQRARAAYRACEFGRFEVLDEDELEDCSIPLLSSWALHAWMLEQGVRAESARPITRALIALERRNELLWMLGEQPVDPPVAKGDPIQPGLTVAISEGELVFEGQRLEQLAHGQVEAAGRMGSLIPSLHEVLRRARERSAEPPLLRVIADAETPVDTFHAVLHSAERAGLAEFALIVRDQEGGAYSQLPLAASGRWAPSRPPTREPSSVDDRFAAFMHDPDGDEQSRHEGPAAAIPGMTERLAQGGLGERPRLSVELHPEGYSAASGTGGDAPRTGSWANDWAALATQAEAFAATHPESKLAVVSAVPSTTLRQLAPALESLRGRECDPASGRGCAIESIVLVARNAHTIGDQGASRPRRFGGLGPDHDPGAGTGLGKDGLSEGDSAEPAAATERRVRVRIGSARTKGNLDSSIVTRIVRQHIGQLQSCYEAAVAKAPGHAGKMSLEFAIGSSGKAREVSSSNTKLDRALTRCVSEQAARWRFPAPRGGSGEVLVWIELDFSLR